MASNINANKKVKKMNYQTITGDTVVDQPSLTHTNSRTSEDSITSACSGTSSNNTSDGQRDSQLDQKDINTSGSLLQVRLNNFIINLVELSASS